MNPKIRIASLLLASGLLLVCAWPAAGRASTLLSGYGGPGAGEQAVIGAQLLNGASGGSAGGGRPSGGAGPEQAATPTQAPGAGGESLAAGARRNSPRAGGAPGARRHGSSGSAEGGGASGHAFAYPSALRLRTSSPALGLSTGDWTALAAGVVLLVALGAITVRTARFEQ
jgi:hypothetical protein